VAELVEKFSSSDYRIDDKLSRRRWIATMTFVLTEMIDEVLAMALP